MNVLKLKIYVISNFNDSLKGNKSKMIRNFVKHTTILRKTC